MSSEKNEIKNLMQKLAEITQSVERIPKNGFNDFHKYHYALESDIKDVVRKELSERKLAMIPNEVSRSSEEIQTKNGIQQLVTLKIEYTIFDAESGESIKFAGYGDGQDAGDKAVYKAKTGALKYALTSLFMIPTGDDPEAEGKKPLQPPKKISEKHLEALTALIKKVAEISHSNPANVAGTLKIDLGYTGEFGDMIETEFNAALEKLNEWKKMFLERNRQTEPEPQTQQQTPNNSIPWGKRQ